MIVPILIVAVVTALEAACDHRVSEIGVAAAGKVALK
jgi:hypothetical protein